MSSNLLKDRYPEIFAQLHPTKNVGMDVDRLTSKSHKEPWWLCLDPLCNSCGHHEWQSRVFSRSSGQGCPFRSGAKTCPCLSFMTDALLAAEFTVDLNPGINPWIISKGSHKVINWRCSNVKCNACGHHNWSATVCERVRHPGCPFLFGKRTCNCLSFMNIQRLRNDYVQELNKLVDPWQLSQFSNKFLNWKCVDCGHVWNASICNRNRSRCPECTRHKDQSKGSERITIYIDSLIEGMLPVKCIYDKPIWCECLKISPCKCHLPSHISLPNRRRYDFIFQYRRRWFIIEFDGEQHFAFRPTSNRHKHLTNFLDKQQIDLIKNLAALLAGFTVIRISNDDEKHIHQVLNYFLHLEHEGPFLGLDDAKKYEHMLKPPTPEALAKHFPKYESILAERKEKPNFPTLFLPDFNQLQVSPTSYPNVIQSPPQVKVSRLKIAGKSPEEKKDIVKVQAPIKVSRLKIVRSNQDDKLPLPPDVPVKLPSTPVAKPSRLKICST